MTLKFPLPRPVAALAGSLRVLSVLATLTAAPLLAQTFEVSPSATEAARLFQKICAANQDHLRRSIGALRNMGFIEDEDNLFFHPSYDLSIAVRQQDESDQWYCSLVWASSDPLPANIAAIAAVAPTADRPDFHNTDLMRTRIFGSY